MRRDQRGLLSNLDLMRLLCVYTLEAQEATERGVCRLLHAIYYHS